MQVVPQSGSWKCECHSSQQAVKVSSDHFQWHFCVFHSFWKASYCMLRCEFVTSLSDLPTKMNTRSLSCTSQSSCCCSPSCATSLWATGKHQHTTATPSLSVTMGLLDGHCMRCMSKSYVLDFRFLDAILNFLLVWYYCTLTIRESILITNGSRSAQPPLQLSFNKV